MDEERAVLETDDGRADVDADVDKGLGLKGGRDGGAERGVSSVWLCFFASQLDSN